MSALSPVEQLKQAVGEKDFPTELERSDGFIVISAAGNLFLLSKSSIVIERLGVSFLKHGLLSRFEQEALSSRLAGSPARDYLPLALKRRLEGTTVGRPQLIAEALKRREIPLYRIKKPAEYHAPAKQSALDFIDNIPVPAAPTDIAKPKTPTHWVEFCYQYQDNKKPISNVPFVLTLPDGSEIDGLLPANGKVRIEDIKNPGEASIVYGEESAEQEVSQLRREIKQALDTIIKEERAEAAEIEEWYDDYNGFSQYFIDQYYTGKGIVKGAWGLIEWVGNVTDAVSQLGILDSMLRAAWQEKYSYEDEEWKNEFLKNFKEQHKKKIVKAMGFDPESITREQIAEAYEVYNLIKSDSESRGIVWDFIKEYASAQHRLEIAEAGGELGFEFILSAILAFFTGGTGAVALAPRLASKMPKLGNLFRRLGKALKKLKLRKKAKGNTNKSTTTEVKKPEKSKLEPKKPNKFDFLRNFKYKGLQAQRIKEGNPDKIAVIGRSMSNPPDEPGVKEFAQALRQEGKNVEIFDGNLIPKSAKNDFQKRIEIKKLSDGKGWLTDEELLKTKMYKANKQWAEKLQREGYTIIDIGNPYAKSQSVFYEMEKQIIF